MAQDSGAHMPQKKFCTQCGAPLPQNARFCQACGVSTETSRAPPMQTMRYGTRESTSSSSDRMNRIEELGKTLTVYLTLGGIVLFLLVVFFPIGIIAFFAWMYIIHKHRQRKRVRYHLNE